MYYMSDIHLLYTYLLLYGKVHNFSYHSHYIVQPFSYLRIQVAFVYELFQRPTKLQNIMGQWLIFYKEDKQYFYFLHTQSNILSAFHVHTLEN